LEALKNLKELKDDVQTEKVNVTLALTLTREKVSRLTRMKYMSYLKDLKEPKERKNIK